MTGKTFKLEIVTPREVVYSGEAKLVELPGAVAPFQVLYNHAPILTELEIGVIRVVGPDDRDQFFATSGGFAEVKGNVATVIAETVEAAGDIDVQRAEAAKDRAKDRVRASHTSEQREKIDAARAEAALARATNRLQVAARL